MNTTDCQRQPRHRQRRGFSLVEIVLAIGIVTFALTAVFGLVALALQSSRSSAEDDVVAFMSQSLTTQYRRFVYTDSNNKNDDTNETSFFKNPSLVYYRYFDAQGTPFCDADGLPIEDKTENIPADADGRSVAWVCEISTRDNPAPDAALNASGVTLIGTISGNTVTVSSQLLQLQFRFFRVAGGQRIPPVNKPTAIIVSSLATLDDPL